MRLRKGLILAVATGLLLSGVGAGVVLTTDDTASSQMPETVQRSVTTKSEQPASSTGSSAKTVADSSDSALATAEAASTETQPIDPIQAMKDEIAQAVTTRATESGIENVKTQTFCADYVIMQEGGYTREIVDHFLDLYINPGATGPHFYFRDACYVTYNVPPSA